MFSILTDHSQAPRQTSSSQCGSHLIGGCKSPVVTPKGLCICVVYLHLQQPCRKESYHHASSNLAFLISSAKFSGACEVLSRSVVSALAPFHLLAPLPKFRCSTLRKSIVLMSACLLSLVRRSQWMKAEPTMPFNVTLFIMPLRKTGIWRRTSVGISFDGRLA